MIVCLALRYKDVITVNTSEPIAYDICSAITWQRGWYRARYL